MPTGSTILDLQYACSCMNCESFLVVVVVVVVVVVDFIILLGESQQAVPFYWEPYVKFYEYNEYRGGAGLAAFRWKGIPSVRCQKRNRV